jgi:transposase-like protein
MAETAPQYAEPHFYTRKFKLEAVRLSETTEKSAAQIARELGVPERVLYRWRRQLREARETAFPGKGHQSELEAIQTWLNHCEETMITESADT